MLEAECIWFAHVYPFMYKIKVKELTEVSLYTILQILSLTLFEKKPLDQLLKNSEQQMDMQIIDNQLNLFD